MAIALPANGQTTLYSGLAQQSGTSITLTKPSGLADGDYLLFLGNTYGSGPCSWSSPVCSGWTNIATETSASGDTYCLVAAYKYIADASEEPANYAFTFNVSNKSFFLFNVSGFRSTTITHFHRPIKTGAKRRLVLCPVFLKSAR